MLYPIFSPSYPFMSLKTQPHPSKHHPKQILFLIPHPQSGGVVPIYPQSPPNHRGRVCVGGVWHKASVSDCLPLAAPIGLSPLLTLTLCGSERVLVVSTEPPDDLSCLTTPGVGDGPLPVPLTRCIQMHTPSPCGGLPTPALTCARWGVHLQDSVPDRGF